jgi:predicted DNA-binding antitoxin AbrB/MazE fold protein
MGRKIRGAEETKTQKINIRVDAALRRRIESFIKTGPFEGEELQVVIRMLIRQGLDVQEKFKQVLEGIEKEISKSAASWARKAKSSSSPI